MIKEDNKEKKYITTENKLCVYLVYLMRKHHVYHLEKILFMLKSKTFNHISLTQEKLSCLDSG